MTKFRPIPRYLLPLILYCCTCSSDDITLYNRIQIFRNSILQQEFIYDNNGRLKYEIYNSIHNGFEKVKYNNLSDNRVDFISVFDKNDIATREEYYNYDVNGDLDRVNIIIHSDTWWMDFDYGAYIVNFSGYYTGDTVANKKWINPFDNKISWSIGTAGNYSYSLNSSKNIDNFYYYATHLLLSYDTHKNPLYQFKDSRPLPLRMTPNNVNYIESRFTGQGSNALNFRANITYSYNKDDTPALAIWNFDFPPGRIDTVRYIYDKVNY